MPSDLMSRARHASNSTAMNYYVSNSADELGDWLRMTLGTQLGTKPQNGAAELAVDIDANSATIKS